VFVLASSQGAPVSALVWWIIPLLALIGGIGYAYWITKWKNRYENQTHRSVGNFRKFQESFNENKLDSGRSVVRVRKENQSSIPEVGDEGYVNEDR
jgi:hypothetical protein